VSSKAAAPIASPEGAAKALASRRESVTAATKEKATDGDAKALKQFVEDGGHFSLVRYVALSASYKATASEN
jgi:hypothetical protein